MRFVLLLVTLVAFAAELPKPAPEPPKHLSDEVRMRYYKTQGELLKTSTDAQRVIDEMMLLCTSKDFMLDGKGFIDCPPPKLVEQPKPKEETKK